MVMVVEISKRARIMNRVYVIGLLLFLPLMLIQCTKESYVDVRWSSTRSIMEDSVIIVRPGVEELKLIPAAQLVFEVDYSRSRYMFNWVAFRNQFPNAHVFMNIRIDDSGDVIENEYDNKNFANALEFDYIWDRIRENWKFKKFKRGWLKLEFNARGDSVKIGTGDLELTENYQGMSIENGRLHHIRRRYGDPRIIYVI